MSRRWPLLALAALAVLLTPGASAQAEPRATVTLTDVAAGTLDTELFRVGLRLSNIVCPSAAAYDVMLLATGGMPSGGNLTDNFSVDFTFTPSKATFTVPAGIHVAQPYVGQVEASVLVRPSRIPFGGLELPVTLVARFQDSGACQSQGRIPTAEATQDFTIRYERSTEPRPTEPDGPQMPAPGFALAALALAAALYLRRRR
jgi:MYXO-CTERM domain-containing protein